MDWIMLGKRIRRIRLQKRLTQEQLAYNAETSNIYICKIENGTAKPTIPKLMKLCKALECPVSYLLDGQEITKYDTNASEISRLLDSCSPYMVKVIRNFVETLVNTNEF